ncbi:tetratricopeptide repeat protein [Pseudohongiella sp. O18]|uniref:tetratricopeptide repeat protein n=2 Tax=unclassified Pseudohongiella TaxID=2629611 RepID=UPI001F16F78B|nr:tetratricopeptide repeat protein [Pseudohongiella sp. O18]
MRNSQCATQSEPASRPVIWKRSLLVALLLVLQACAARPYGDIDTLLADLADLHGSRPDIVTPDDVHYLTDQQKSEFLDYFNRLELSAYPAHQRLYFYMKDKESGFNYQTETLPAAETLETNSGNCLSLAIRTTALAQLVGLDVGWQLMSEAPVYDLTGPYVEKGVHVRSVVYSLEHSQSDGDDRLNPFNRGITIDYFRSGRERFVANLSYESYVALFYRNVAVEALRKGDVDLAYWNAVESLRFAPDHPDALNTLAVINRQQGRYDEAEQIYRYAISHADDKLTVLKNYRSLLAIMGREADARRIERQLMSMPDSSPFHWYQVAQSAMEEGDYPRAIEFFYKALEVAPYLHEAYAGIASANYQLGNIHSARLALTEAMEQASRRSAQRVYKSKMAAYYSD